MNSLSLLRFPTKSTCLLPARGNNLHTPTPPVPSWGSEITLPLIRFYCDKTQLSVSLSLPRLHTRPPKGIRNFLCFLCNLSRGVSASCIFYSEAFRAETHGEGVERERRRRMGMLSWIERCTTQSSVNSYSEKKFVMQFLHSWGLVEVLHHLRRGPYLEKTDHVLPSGKQAGRQAG